MCKIFFNPGSLLIFLFLLVMALIQYQTAPAQAEDEKKGSIGSHTTISVKIGNLEDPSKRLAIILRDRLGAELRFVSAEEAEKYHLNFLHGVVIAWLDPIGPLSEVGFEVGDIILEINGKAIEGYEDFLDLLKSFKPHQLITFLALDHRSGHTGYVQIKAQ